MVAGIGKTHLVALPLDLHQRLPGPAQQPDADRLVVDAGAGPSVPVHDPAHHHLVFRRDAVLVEQGEHGMAGRGKEAGGDAGLLGAGANQAGIGACAEGQAQAVEQDGLAGAGFAGQHGQAGAEPQVQPLDQDDVTDR